jgi:hypothetical protein
MKSPLANWLGRPIVDAEDQHDLERRAAIHEFGSKMPRHEAEARAYEDYVRDRRLDAAAHHLAGVKAAQASGNMDEARKHGVLYELHMKALDLNPHGPVPPEVSSKLNGKDAPQIYRFKAHKGDHFALQDREGEKAEEVKKSELGRELLKKVADDRPSIDVMSKAQKQSAETDPWHMPRDREEAKRAAGNPHLVERGQQVTLRRQYRTGTWDWRESPGTVENVHYDRRGNVFGVTARNEETGKSHFVARVQYGKGVPRWQSMIFHGGSPAERESRALQYVESARREKSLPLNLVRPAYEYSDDYVELAHRPFNVAQLGKSETDPELARETCDYTAWTTKERCKNPRSRKVGDRYLCHHHSDPAAKDEHKAEKQK